MLSISLLLGYQIAMGPVLPPGCDSSFANAVQLVEQSLERSDFATAKTRLAWLPSRTITVQWQDQNVPAGLRAEYAKARDRAFAAWIKAIPTLKIALGKKPAVSVSFVEKFDLAPGDLVAPAAKHKVNLDSYRRILSQISLTRGAKGRKASPLDIQNETAYSIGSYLGLTLSPIYTEVMGRTDQPNSVLARVTSADAAWAAECLAASDILRSAALAKKRIAKSYPVADIKSIEPASTDTVQGDKPIYTLTMTNRGNSTLRYRLASTCACMNMERNGSVAPGDTQKVEVELDTTEFKGKLSKILYVYTNDGDQGILQLQIKSNIEPQYRLLSPKGTAFIMSKTGVEFDVFLSLPDRTSIKPLRASIDGVNAQVTMEPWKGVLADPEMDEGEKSRKGFKLHVTVPDQAMVGRKPATLTVNTDNFTFRLLQFNFSVQKGIVALPISIYFGQVKPGVSASATLSRPGHPFKVTGIEVAEPYLEARIVEDSNGDEQKLEVTLKSNAPVGAFRSIIKVKTDDPDQPEVLVGVGGTVK